MWRRRSFVSETSCARRRQIRDVGQKDMQTCPQCHSPRMTMAGAAFWTSCCKDCGFTSCGTASFPLEIEIEHEYDFVFRLSSPKQIPIVCSIARELSNRSTAELLEAYRKDDTSITVPCLAMWRARDYAQKAKLQGIETTIVYEKGA